MNLSVADSVGVLEAVNQIGNTFMIAFFLGLMVGLFVYILRGKR
jgi:uncharacterized protein involved in exopolysaccharide biosynthesis